ncbi:hypothetical protein Aduo_003312 [Ancylostoma duodenale]
MGSTAATQRSGETNSVQLTLELRQDNLFQIERVLLPHQDVQCINANLHVPSVLPSVEYDQSTAPSTTLSSISSLI